MPERIGDGHRARGRLGPGAHGGADRAGAGVGGVDGIAQDPHAHGAQAVGDLAHRVVDHAALVGLIVDRVALRTLYRRDHLDQVLATFGLILFFNELVRLIWGPVLVLVISTSPRRWKENVW